MPNNVLLDALLDIVKNGVQPKPLYGLGEIREGPGLTQPQVPPTMPQQPAQIQAQPQTQPQIQSGNKLPVKPNPNPSLAMDFLRQLGIPLATTAIGLGFPKALPGAAGFSTGFNTGMENAKTKELEFEKLRVSKKQEDIENERENRKEDISIRKVVQDGLDTLIKEGIFDPKKQDYQKTVDEQVQAIKEKLGLANTSAPQENSKIEKAKKILSDAGRDISDQSIQEFIKRNPNL